ncbi:hypothetical protein [Candidatus Entotheonella palauensis]|uniref:hypothetical protein n=1 Tax=Candidatus Entotheonella palauensis TaxID=93172 RepID=UPI0015C4D97B|nr:hypothetical protein [Candidatus Entotheonella palauensis]
MPTLLGQGRALQLIPDAAHQAFEDLEGQSGAGLTIGRGTDLDVGEMAQMGLAPSCQLSYKVKG